MINNVTLVGRLTKDLELQRTNSGTPFVRFSVAVDGFGNEDTSFIPCVAWSKQAETMQKFLMKGSLVGVTGRISVQNYEKNGDRRTFTEVVANNVQFLETKTARTERTQEFKIPTPAKPRTEIKKASDSSALDKLFSTSAKVETAPEKKPEIKKEVKSTSSETIDWLDNFL